MLAQLRADARVPRLADDTPRTRPDRVLADKAYATGVNRRYLRSRRIERHRPRDPLRRSRVNRRYLRSRRIGAVIPQKRIEVSSRAHKGRRVAAGPRRSTRASTMTATSSTLVPAGVSVVPRRLVQDVCQSQAIARRRDASSDVGRSHRDDQVVGSSLRARTAAPPRDAGAQRAGRSFPQFRRGLFRSASAGARSRRSFSTGPSSGSFRRLSV